MNRRHPFSLPFLHVLLLLAASILLAQAAPPANDHFANRIPLSGSFPIVTNSSSLGATKENGEPSHAGHTGGASVWWTWTAPADGLYTIRTDGSSFNTTLGVYAGTAVNALFPFASDDDAGAGNSSLVTFIGMAGTTFEIAVDGVSGASGDVTLTIDPPIPLPQNDNFANRTSLGSGAASVTSCNVGCTREDGEPMHAGYPGGSSVWFTWTAPSSGICTLGITDMPFTPLVGVYTGTAVNSLTPVSSGINGGPHSFLATAGTVYQFALDSYLYSPTGKFTLTVSEPMPLPQNDNFANRTSLGSAPFSITSNNFNCTAENGEPHHAGYYGGMSMWFTWTAPSNGDCRLEMTDYQFTPLLAVYTGSALNALTPVASGTFGNPAAFVATAGTVYQFAVDSYSASGPFTLTLSGPIPPPANDDFANAIVIPSVPANITASNEHATLELGEPITYLGGGTGGRSVWWRWTAPVSGELVLQTSWSPAFPNYYPRFAMYTGSAVGSLTPVTGYWFDAQTVTVVAGTTYHIAVDGANGSSGTAILRLSQVYPKPANDDFASRAVLPSSNISISGNTLGATKEAGEPGHSSGFEAGSRSVWWSWTASTSGQVDLTINGSSLLLSVYTGSSVDALTPVIKRSTGSPYRFVSFDAVAGTTYHIAVDTYSFFGPVIDGAFSLHLSDTISSPANDNFANRILLAGSPAKAEGSNRGASKELGEPNHGSNVGGKSVWYSWTAPVTGSFNAYVQGSTNFSVQLGIYTGAGVGSLTATPMTYLSSSPVGFAFSATSGTTYHFAVDGYNSGQFALSGDFVLNISQPPANEAFANATSLGSSASGASASWVDYSSGTEPGEPGASPYSWVPGPRTIWWQWTAPASGFFTFDTLGADFDTALQIYTGTAVTALTRVAENRDADPAGRSSLVLNAAAGTTYHIRVSGETPQDVGQVPLHWSQFGSPVTAADYVALGRAHLQQQTNASVTSADAAFASALAIDANHPEANFLKALTTFVLLEQGAALQDALTGLGIVDSDIYARGWTLPKDGAGKYVAQPGASTTAVAVNYLADTVLPALTVIRAHLAKASSPSFVTSVSDTETAANFVIIDAGDVSLIQACLHGLEAVTRLLQTYNAGVNVAEVITAANNDQLNVENVAKSFTNLLTFTGNDQRAAFKTALQNANTHYQAGSTFARTLRADKRDRRHLFYLRASADRIDEEIRENLQATSDSLNGAAALGGETVNLAQAITSSKSLREQLFGLVGNKGVASTVPDPTFDGVVPNSSQAKVNRFLRRTGFLHEIANFSNWAAAFLGGQSAPNQAKGADPDKDMLTNFAEYAFNLNPGKASATQEYAVNSLQTNVADGKTYLNLTFVRRIDRAAIDYTVAVSDDLATWDRTGAQLQQVGAAIPNADGVTETVTFRVLSDPTVTSRKFVRLEVSDLNP